MIYGARNQEIGHLWGDVGGMSRRWHETGFCSAGHVPYLFFE